MLLMTGNTRSGGVGQGRPKGSRACGRSAAESLDGRRSGGYAAAGAQGLATNFFNAARCLPRTIACPPRSYATAYGVYAVAYGVRVNHSFEAGIHLHTLVASNATLRGMECQHSSGAQHRSAFAPE